MKLSKLTLILTLIGILILTLLAQSKPIYQATVQSIQTSSYKTTIQLQNQTTELIIFDTPNLNLTKNDQIKFQGKPDTYRNQKQIIIERISKISN
ncbi:hypothetical protein HN903_04525 [archaeon]|jgi:hypothetical protein|nr:hypothetical protein [archaeon]MBT7128993.1 hypothetical protein [archaeon]